MSSLLQILIPALVVVALVAFVTYRTGDGYVAAFAQTYAVPLTPETVGALRATIGRSRRIRGFCAAIAVIALTALRDDFGLWGFLGALALGFGIGSIIDELTRPAPSRQTRVGASLERRSVTNYVERWVLVSLAGMSVLVAFEGWRALVVEQRDWSWSAPWSDAQIGGVLGLAVGCLAGGSVAINRIVQHRTPAGSADLQALRHGVRVAGVLSVVGAMMVVLGTAGFTLTAFAMNGIGEREPFNWIHFGALSISALAFFLGIQLSVRAFPSGAWSRDLPALPDVPMQGGSTA